MSLFGSSNWVLPPAHFKKGFAEEVTMSIVPAYPMVVQGYEEGDYRSPLSSEISPLHISLFCERHIELSVIGG